MILGNKKIGFKQSRESLENYFLWRVSRAKETIERIKSFRKLKASNVLDIGFGYGALCSTLLDSGAKVTGVEIDPEKIKFASKRIKNKRDIKLIKVKNEKLPFKDEKFDIVFLFDVMEHLKNPKRSIRECHRVLKPNGLLYVEFAPYYSITGHHLYDFFPGPIHLLPRKYIKKMVYAKKLKGYFDNDYYWNQFESCNKIRISEFQELVKNLEKIEERFIIKYPDFFFVNLPFLNRLGPFKDFFTMVFDGTYVKKIRKRTLYVR